MRIFLRSLGCRVNWSEVATLARQFAACGQKLVSAPQQADVCVVNTCAVTESAERKSLHVVQKLGRDHPQARVAVIGCYATLDPDRCASLPNVAWVIPNTGKAEVVDQIADANVATPIGGSEPAPRARIAWRGMRTRAFVKVQDGCDNGCTYCLTRILRGQARSKPLEAVVDEVRTLVRCGYQEVVLVGVNLGAYGHDSGRGNSLLGLGRALLTDTDVPRLRFSSIEPWDVCEEFFDLWDSPRVCRQIHLPLQAGCDDTLRRMGRPITTETFLRLLQAARQRIPELAVTTDVMVAFPGENERAFRESLTFVERCAFARLHVFRYSARPGTRAAHMALLPPEVVNARADAMRNLGQRLAAQYRDRFVGQRMAVLWERRRADGRWYGWTDNYLRVAVESACDLHNRIIPTELVGTSEGVLSGHLRLNRDEIPAIGA